MIRIEYNRDLTGMNTFRMKVSCACLVEYDCAADLGEIPPGLPQPYFYIGGGSNLLFTGDFPGTVFHSAIRFIRVLSGTSGESGDTVLVEAGAGVVFDEFCRWAAERGLWGTENLSLIPGEVGAAAVQNIGAYGAEVCDVIDRVVCFDVVTRREVSFRASECRYGYRDSIFKDTARGRYVVTSVVFRLSSVPAPNLGYGHVKAAVESLLGSPVEDAAASLTPSLVREAVVSIRESKLPDPSETGSAGSFFRNPVVPKSSLEHVMNIARFENGAGCTVPHYDMGSGFVKIPAAWLIEQCGWKGYREGNVGVYDRQPLVIVNLTGNAEPWEVLALEKKIVDSVASRFGITLHPEVEHVGISGNSII